MLNVHTTYDRVHPYDTVKYVKNIILIMIIIMIKDRYIEIFLRNPRKLINSTLRIRRFLPIERVYISLSLFLGT